MAAKRPTTDQLSLAAEWLDYYDGGDDGQDDEDAAKAVAAWLRAEIDRRRTDAAVAQLARETGATRAHARKVLLRVRRDRQGV